MFKQGIVKDESGEVDSSQIMKGCGKRRSQTVYAFGPCDVF